MWNHTCSNKYLDKLQKQQAYKNHITTLYFIKPTLNKQVPTKYNFLKTKPKAQLNKLQRQNEIQRTNTILVKKISNNSSRIKNKDMFQKGSLNSTIVKKREDIIDKENQRLVRKIQQVQSQYSKTKMTKDIQQYQRIKSNVAFSRIDPQYDLMQSLQPSTTRIQKKRNKRPKTAKL